MLLLSLIFAINAEAARYFALVDDGNVVQKVIVAEPEVIAKRTPAAGWQWLETWTDGGARKRYAGKGYEYHPDVDGFAPKKPYSKWKLNKETMFWEPPVGKEKPKDGKDYNWDDDAGEWVEEKKP